MLVAALHETSSNPILSKKEKRTLGRYFLETFGGESRLCKVTSKKIVIPIKQYLDAIKRAHEELGHAGWDITVKFYSSVFSNGRRVSYGNVPPKTKKKKKAP